MPVFRAILRDLVSRFLLGTLKPPPVFETHFGVALVERLGFRADAQIPVPGFSAKVLSCRPALFRWRLPLPEIFSLRTRRSVQIPAQGSILPPLKRALQRFSFFSVRFSALAVQSVGLGFLLINFVSLWGSQRAPLFSLSWLFLQWRSMC
jgi:hypothetical protein